VLLALGLILSGCGGGGGGGVASTPTPIPTPAPTPAPTPVNTSLTSLADGGVDESFTNDVASLSLTSASGASAALSSGTIAFARAQRSYTLTVGTNSQSFAPGDIDQTLRQNDTSVYLKSSGSVQNRMELNHAGSLPPWSYKYVGGSIWTRGEGGTELNSYAFSYGVETADSATPRSGTASFDVRLIGRGFWAQDYTHLTGNGTIRADFGTGAITGSGLALEQSSNSRKAVASGDWSMNATLSSSTNAFSGTFRLYPGLVSTLSGTVAGRFYGPSGNELGGSYAINGTSPLGAGGLVGVLLGAKQDPAVRNVSLVSPTVSFNTTEFKYGFRSVSQFINVSPSTGQIDANYLSPSTYANVPDRVEYQASNGTYILKKLDTSTVPNTAKTIFTTNSTPDAATSDSRFVSHVLTTGNVTERVQLYRPAGSNSDIALTYTSLIDYRRVEPSTTAAGKTEISNTWMAYGILSDRASFPASGTANYVGRLYGSAVDGIAGSKPYAVEGTNQFTINFANDSFGGSFSPILVASDGTRTILGSWALAAAQLNIRDTSFPGLDATLVTNAGANGQVSGLFFGPAASELAGTFRTRWIPVGGVGISGDMVGAFAAVKQ
jgi:hypothetical protein